MRIEDYIRAGFGPEFDADHTDACDAATPVVISDREVLAICRIMSEAGTRIYAADYVAVASFLARWREEVER